MCVLSSEDLQTIGTIVDQKLEPVLEAIREGFEQTATKAELAAMRHALMDHTDRTVTRAVGDLRVELKGDINGLRTDFNGLRAEVKELRTDFNGFRTELSGRGVVG